jgi:hypothetical protein
MLQVGQLQLLAPWWNMQGLVYLVTSPACCNTCLLQHLPVATQLCQVRGVALV